MSAQNPQQQPTQEELQAYFEQLRQAPVEDLLMQAFSVLGTGAEVKVGMPEARVLIDSMEALIGAAGSVLEQDVTEQLKQAVVQLKTSQVQAERTLAAREQQGAGDGETDQHAAGDQTPPAAGEPQPGSAQQPGSAPQPGGEEKMTDRLWIPGKE